MGKRLVIKPKDVLPFSPQGAENSFESRLLVDRESVGSGSLVANHFTLKPGKSTEGASHPAPYDELYCVLKGTGVVRLGEAEETFELEPNTVVFIPGGTMHSLENNGSENLELLTVMPRQMVEGANSLYDERLRTWGTSFKLKESA